MEADYLQWLKRRVSDGGRGAADALPLGIGDDAAVISTSERTVVCTDLIAEGTHFTISDDRSLAAAGRKALAVNLSDLAAMGAIPKTAFLSLLVNKTNAYHQAVEITSGLLELAEAFGVSLAGGDTCSWSGPVVINVTATGELIADPILRSGAQVGDVILASGEFGGSLLGKHHSFVPRVDAMVRCCDFLRRNEDESLSGVTGLRLHSACDVSDGLACDLDSILQASHKSATLFAERIPIAGTVFQHLQHLSQAHLPAWKNLESSDEGSSEVQALKHALYDGEDFELVITTSSHAAKLLLMAVDQRHLQLGCRLTEIGRIEAATTSPQIHLEIQGQRIPLPPLGYQH